MFLKIEKLEEKKLIGKKLSMSFAENKTRELWQSFMPFKRNIQNIIGNELYSLEVYPSRFFDEFSPKVNFDKWAAVEVTELDSVPNGMETLIVPKGLYAVFLHKGPASEGPKTYGYIFGSWIPGSGYKIDSRPHFALMGEKYKNDSPDSEEEIWIPVK